MKNKQVLSIFQNRDEKKTLFIFEMANNHMGDVKHGLRIIRELSKVSHEFDYLFAVKFQYRYLDSFVHPDYINNTDHRLIKRFKETILNEDQYKILKDEVDSLGMISICTPWDNKSVDLIVKHKYDILKIPSCYFNDWPLLEKIATTNLPIIASTAGAKLSDIDNVVNFLQHRDKKFAIMHCVGEYPTPNEDLQLNQIDLLKSRYVNIPIGFSTHESPNNLDSIKLAVAKGAEIFEKHVGIKTKQYNLNAYSANPKQIKEWLLSAQKSYDMCGVINRRQDFSNKEINDLRILHRGVYAKKKINKGDVLGLNNVFFAMPNSDNQLVANDFSKYKEFITKSDIAPNAPVIISKLIISNRRDNVEKILTKVKTLLKRANIKLPNNIEMELSHHYGIDRFYEYGAVIINIVNREYSKKLLILLPGQKYPMHSHKKKEETMHILYGDMTIQLNEKESKLNSGEIMVIERNKDHAFKTKNGVVLEEISTTYFKGDSYWEDETILNNPRRKIQLSYWSDFFND